jgi:hypothetical protein
MHAFSLENSEQHYLSTYGPGHNGVGADFQVSVVSVVAGKINTDIFPVYPLTFME